MKGTGQAGQTRGGSGPERPGRREEPGWWGCHRPPQGEGRRMAGIRTPTSPRAIPRKLWSAPKDSTGVPWVRHWPDPGLPLLPAKTARLYPDARPLGAGLDVCLAWQGRGQSCLLVPAVHPKPGRVCPGCMGELPEGKGRLPEEQRPWPGPRGRPLVGTRPQVRGRGRGSRQLPGPAASIICHSPRPQAAAPAPGTREGRGLLDL